jgi:hypothetical protein
MQIPRWHGFDKQSLMLISHDNPDEKFILVSIIDDFNLHFLPVYPGGH